MVAKHQATKVVSKYIAVMNNVINVNAIITKINTKVASIQLSFSSRCTPRNLFILTLFLGYIVNILIKYYQGLQKVFNVDNFRTVA